MKKFTFLIVLNLLFHFSFSQEKMDVFDVARKGTIEQVKEILKTNPKAFNVINNDGYSPLTLACYRGNNEVAKLLIENGSDINGNSKMGTPLMASVVVKNNDIAEFLIAKNANINAANENGFTALIYAAQFSNDKILKLLLKHNANKNIKDKEGKTAFEYAVFIGNEEIINLLK